MIIYNEAGVLQGRVEKAKFFRQGDSVKELMTLHEDVLQTLMLSKVKTVSVWLSGDNFEAEAYLNHWIAHAEKDHAGNRYLPMYYWKVTNGKR